MKTPATLLLIAALSSVLCFAQEVPTSTTLITQLNTAPNVAAVAALEATFASNLSSYSDSARSDVANALWRAYTKCVARKEVVDGYWTIAVLPRYVANWDASTVSACAAFYSSVVGIPATNAFMTRLKGVQTPNQFDAQVSAYFATNPLPERLQADFDSRKWSTSAVLAAMGRAATRVGHPEALNYTLLAYKQQSIRTDNETINGSISSVAAALKAKDFNLTRANTWIEGQNTGTPSVTFSTAELAKPTLLVSATWFPDISIEAAKAAYRAATTPFQIDGAVYQVATALKAIDLNFARANAWITAQKNGTAYDLP